MILGRALAIVLIFLKSTLGNTAKGKLTGNSQQYAVNANLSPIFQAKWHLPFFKSSNLTLTKMICKHTRLARFVRIVGGTTVKWNEDFIPWRVRIGTNPDGLPTRDNCGGTIISPHLVLTAAHCLQPHSKLPFFIYYDTVTPNGGGSTKFAQADAIAWHEGYVGKAETGEAVRFEHDIGLLRFSKPLNFSGRAKSVCLPWSFDDFPLNYTKMRTVERHGTVSGWGITASRTATNQHFYQSCDLRKVELSAITTKECNDWYQELYRTQHRTIILTNKTRPLLPRMRLTDDMFCAESIHRGRSSAAAVEFGGFCLGDSGGGFDYSFGGNVFTVGIISTVYMGLCGHRFPNKLIKITPYLPWIDAHSNDAGYQLPKDCK